MRFELTSACILLLCLHCTSGAPSGHSSIVEALLAALRAGQQYYEKTTTTTEKTTTTTITTTTTTTPESTTPESTTPESTTPESITDIEDVMEMEAVMGLSVDAKINLASLCKKFCKRRSNGKLKVRKCKGRRNANLCLVCRITLNCFSEGVNIF